MNFESIYKKSLGFTLIELMVSITIFSIVMVISMGAILTTLDSNRKSQSIRTVMDNLNYTLEGMTRTIMFATNYHCDVNFTPITDPRDCLVNGASSLTVTVADGSQVTYKLLGSKIVKTLSGGLNPGDYDLTSPDVNVQKLLFFVSGSYPYTGGSSGNDQLQPRVIVVVGGQAGSSVKTSTQASFSLETTLSQRKFDFQ